MDAPPRWARGHQGLPPAVVAQAVAQAVASIRERPPDGPPSGADAEGVLGLWRRVGGPLDALVRQVALVARWARESPDPLASNDLRGIQADGSTWTADRSRSVSTLLDPRRWGDRLEAARRWEAGTVATRRPYVRGDHPGVREPTREEVRQIYESLGMDPQNPEF